MESNKILDADFLDILFDGKNKDYGAYDLRKTYNGRLVKAMIGMGALLLFLFGGYFLSNLNGAPARRGMPIGDTIELAHVTDRTEDPPPPPKPIEPIKIKTLQFTSIIQIVKDVKDDAPPPKQDDIVDTKIGTVNVLDGAKDDGIVAPPSDVVGKGVMEAPKKEEDDRPFIKVEKDAEYPGGMIAWKRYLDRNFRYPEDAVNIQVQGVVVVQFIVDKDGNVSDVQAISGPTDGGLREEAIRVIKKSGKWVPALQNGSFVKAYRKQSVVFQIGE
jgi:protein TonB